MTDQFQSVRHVLETTQRGNEAAQDGPLLQQLIALGLVSPAPEVDTRASVEGEATSQAGAGAGRHVLTADGQDVLEALGSPARWAQVQEAAARQGMDALSLDSLKAAVAAAISGGFNA